MWRKTNPPTLSVGTQIGVVSCGSTVQWFLQKLRIELPHELVISLLAIYKENKIPGGKDRSTPMVITEFLQQPRYGRNPRVHQ